MALTRRVVVAVTGLVSLLFGAGLVQAGAGLTGLPTVLPKVSPGQTAPGVAPPSGQDLLGIIRGSPALKQGVDQAARGLGLDPAKVLAGKAGGARAALPLPTLYRLPPCDWDAGIALTFAQPFAAPSFASGQPPSNWAAMMAYGAQTFDFETMRHQMTGAEVTACLPMSGTVCMDTTPTRGGVWVHLRPPAAGLYVVALALKVVYPAGSFRASCDYMGQLVGQEMDAGNVVAIVRVDPGLLARPLVQGCEVAFKSTSVLSWRFIGVSVKRLGY